MGLHLRRHPWSRRSPLAGDLLRLHDDRGPRRLSFAIELGGPHVVRLQLEEPLPGLLAERHDVGQGLAVLAPEVRQQVPAIRHGGQALGVVVDPLP